MHVPAAAHGPPCTHANAAMQRGYKLADRVLRAADVGVITAVDNIEGTEPDNVGGSP